MFKDKRTLITLVLVVLLFLQTVVLLEQRKEIEGLKHHKDILTNSLGVFYGEFRDKQSQVQVNFEDSENILFAQIVEAEARNQGEVGKQAVAEVILNRVQSKDFPDTIEGVLTQPRQFQPYSSRAYVGIKPSEETLRAIVKAHNEKMLPENVLYFCNYEIIGQGNKSWFDSLNKYDKIGDHTFYGK